MEMNVHKSAEYIIRKFLHSDFSNIENVTSHHAIVERFNQKLFFERVAIETLKDRYYRQTGMIIA